MASKKSVKWSVWICSFIGGISNIILMLIFKGYQDLCNNLVRSMISDQFVDSMWILPYAICILGYAIIFGVGMLCVWIVYWAALWVIRGFKDN